MPPRTRTADYDKTIGSCFVSDLASDLTSDLKSILTSPSPPTVRSTAFEAKYLIVNLALGTRGCSLPDIRVGILLQLAQRRQDFML